MVSGFKMNTHKTEKRHIAKTITWRLVGTIDTIILSWVITGNPFTGLKIGFVEVITKMILYYLHERLWFKSNVVNPEKRHLYKTVTWRILGTMDTMFMAWIVTGDPMIGLQIGISEVFTKMILYYIHEKVWYKLDFGLDERKNK